MAPYAHAHDAAIWVDGDPNMCHATHLIQWWHCVCFKKMLCAGSQASPRQQHLPSTWSFLITITSIILPSSCCCYYGLLLLSFSQQLGRWIRRWQAERFHHATFRVVPFVEVRIDFERRNNAFHAEFEQCPVTPGQHHQSIRAFLVDGRSLGLSGRLPAIAHTSAPTRGYQVPGMPVVAVGASNGLPAVLDCCQIHVRHSWPAYSSSSSSSRCCRRDVGTLPTGTYAATRL
mmetsp:Transcript_28233/g.47477  ORF Transcript_28233/g.47477 Transcript_28233/m.47477 type:complete len:231 (+) Transcript_28233:178-870(+)